MITVSTGVYFADQKKVQKGDPMEFNFENQISNILNMPADRARVADEENGVTCLVIMFTSRVMVVEMLKMAHFLFFLLLLTVKN